MTELELVRELFDKLSEEDKKAFLEDKNNDIDVNFYSESFVSYIKEASSYWKNLYSFESDYVEYAEDEYKHVSKALEDLDSKVKEKYGENSEEFELYKILYLFDYDKVVKACETLGYKYADNKITKDKLISDAVDMAQSILKSKGYSSQRARLHLFRCGETDEYGTYFNLIFSIDYSDNSL